MRAAGRGTVELGQLDGLATGRSGSGTESPTQEARRGEERSRR